MSDPTTHADDPVTAQGAAGTGPGAAGAGAPDDEATEPVVTDADESEPDGSDSLEADAEVEVDEDLDLLAVALRERDEYLDALRRLQADFENYKKRVQKQQLDSVAYAAQALVDKLLPALDTADLAVAHTEGEELRQVRAAFVEALEREGLERIAPEGGPFDPNRHDAVAHEPADGADQEVAEVLRAGYAWKGRVLRPAMVKVRG